MANTYKIAAMHNHFDEHKPIFIDELHQFYKEDEPDLPRSTLRWRIHELISRGELHRIKRGVYRLSDQRKPWKPKITEDLKEIYSGIQQKYPYLECCIWTTQWLTGFTQHMPVQYLTLVDTEIETEAPVFHYLQDRFEKYNVFMKPDKSEVEKYLGTGEKNIVVRSLISQSPLASREEVTVPKLEKIMVDLVADNILFQAFQGRELKNICGYILESYSINQSTLQRYSQRRNKWKEVKSLLNEFANKDTKN
jgi:hypothetical protein